MKNKKGFTLVELLAVIVVLAIIMVIAIPNVIKVIDKAKVNSYQRNESLMINAARNYLASNYDKAPVNIGDISVIELSELQANNVIGNIKDSKSDNNCNGKVMIIKKSSNQYLYNPYLDCSTNYKTYGDYISNGLVLNLDGYDTPQLISGKNYWVDKSANANKAELIGFDSTSGHNINNKSYVFDGINDYMNVPSFQQTQLQANNYTVEMVFTAKENTLNGTYYGILGVNGSIGLPSQQSLGSKTFTSLGKSYIETVISDNTNVKTVLSAEIILGEKTAIEYYSNNGDLGIYKNAANKVNTSYTFTPVFYQNYMFIGWVSATRYAKMDLHAVRIYNRVLTSDEILYNYNIDKQRFGL